MNGLEWLQARYNVSQVQKLAGLTACSHLVITEDLKLVWRQQNSIATALGINYQKEAALLQTLSLSFMPIPYFFHSDFSLLHWIEGKTPASYTNELLIQLADCLAALHRFEWQSTYLVNEKPFSLKEHCLFLWQQLPEKQRQLMENVQELTSIEPFCTSVCHHDIHLENLIERAGKLYLIDWEYAALSDPALEIALFLQGNCLTEEQQAVFFEYYFAKVQFLRESFLKKVREYTEGVEWLNRLWFTLNSQEKATH